MMGNSNHRKKRLAAVGVTVLVALAASGTAFATSVVPHTFGAYGSRPKLNPDCSHGRMAFTPIGRGWATGGSRFTTQGFAVNDATGKCFTQLMRRLRRCLERPPPSPPGAVPAVTGKDDHGPPQPGDWAGVDAL